MDEILFSKEFTFYKAKEKPEETLREQMDIIFSLEKLSLRYHIERTSFLENPRWLIKVYK